MDQSLISQLMTIEAPKESKRSRDISEFLLSHHTSIPFLIKYLRKRIRTLDSQPVLCPTYDIAKALRKLADEIDRMDK